MNIKELQKLVIDFRDKRDRKQFHNPKDLAIGIAIEAGELQEKFLRKSQEDSYIIGQNNPEVADELADVLHSVLLFAEACNIDIIKASIDKLAQNDRKYPVEKAKGKCVKYDKL